MERKTKIGIIATAAAAALAIYSLAGVGQWLGATLSFGLGAWGVFDCIRLHKQGATRAAATAISWAAVAQGIFAFWGLTSERLYECKRGGSDRPAAVDSPHVRPMSVSSS